MGPRRLKEDKSAKVRTENSLLDLQVTSGMATAATPWKRKLGYCRMERAWEQVEKFFPSVLLPKGSHTFNNLLDPSDPLFFNLKIEVII